MIRHSDNVYRCVNAEGRGVWVCVELGRAQMRAVSVGTPLEPNVSQPRGEPLRL